MQLSSAYRAMLRIRLLEERVLECADRGLVAGFVHPSSGQEAVAVGVLAARRPQEWVVSFYRCHGHALAAGMSPDAVVREILGREGGACGGKGGSMHLADRGARFLGASSIVGSQLSVAAGVALAERGETEGDESERDKSGRGVVVFCGDGAIGTGVAYETLTIAATLGLPLLVVCEDNGWQDHTPSALVRHLTPAECVRGLGIECDEVDGNDVVAVHAAAAALMDECRGRSAPRVRVARTYLKHFHAQAGVGRPAEYRPPDEIAYWSARDPLDIAARRIALHQAWFDDQRAQVERELDDVFDGSLMCDLALHLVQAGAVDAERLELVCGAAVPAPAAPGLLDALLPRPDDVAAAALGLLGSRTKADRRPHLRDGAVTGPTGH